MFRNKNTTGISTFLAALLIGIILVGCTSTPTVVVPPTQDIPSIRTESAATVISKLTIEAALNPSATAAAPIVVTATPEPATSTPEAPAASPTATVAVGVLPTNTTAPVTGGGVSRPIPTATRRSGPDQVQYLGQDPLDATKFSPGNQFDAKFTFKNIGTSTWSTDYDMRFERGTNLAEGQPKHIPFTKSVAPGETVTLIFDAVAPPDAGRYTSYWSLINGNGDIFAEFFLIIDVQ